jgi:catechol 2,3-dioxygenase-like lactoylglutathione lyase family enzyme
VFDHVTLGVSDLAEATRFLDTMLEPLHLERYEAAGGVEWGDLSIVDGRPVTRNVTVGLAATADALRSGTIEGLELELVARPSGLGTITHLALGVAELDRARRFYDCVLGSLDVAIQTEEAGVVGFGDGESSLRLDAGRLPTTALHLAFAAASNADVDAFWRAGIEAGFRSNGEPGERAKYHAGYYGAFLLDPAGNNVEAVCHNRRAAPT